MSRSRGMIRLLFVGLAGAGLSVAGCNRGPETYTLSGQVTFHEKPVPSGTIYWEPDTEKGGTGPQAIAKIENGQYRTATGKGVGWGAYKVKVVGYDGKPATQSGEELSEGKPLFIPYETTIALPRQSSTQDIVVLVPDQTPSE
ncbi:MAG: hypothetical protein LC104_13420 [Bacteroidales bacterium]|nr:hypothetical protein [Bacteroidales bacterium]